MDGFTACLAGRTRRGGCNTSRPEIAISNEPSESNDYNARPMKRTEFQYELPEELIAQQPLPERSASRLLCMDRAGGGLSDARVRDLPSLLEPGDLLVFNDTRVIPARLFARKATGGRVEILFERLTGTHEGLAQLRVSKRPKPGASLRLEGGGRLEVVEREGDFWRLASPEMPLSELMERSGHVPLPPYIQREDAAADRERYQTVYARRPGAVAAPTAGLHFDAALLDRLERHGVRRAMVTLHVGAGTFQPVRVDELSEHQMHSEWLEVPETTVAAVNAARATGSRVVAVGTTAVRSLETAAADGELKPYAGESRLFIHPPYEFRVVNGLFTNFHLPESTLLMLVAAFAGLEPTLAAYRHAVAERYRFFSYGDAMLIL